MNFLNEKKYIFYEKSELSKRKSLRTKENDYIEGYKMMLNLEEMANAKYLERFDQQDIQINYHMDRQFYFGITVSFFSR